MRCFVISIDSDDKARFLIKYLNSEFCYCLEVLNLSNSTKLDYNDYEINKSLNNINGNFSQLNTIILNKCKSSAPYKFLTNLLNYENFKRINVLHLNDTFVDTNIFVKM